LTRTATVLDQARTTRQQTDSGARPLATYRSSGHPRLIDESVAVIIKSVTITVIADRLARLTELSNGASATLSETLSTTDPNATLNRENLVVFVRLTIAIFIDAIAESISLTREFGGTRIRLTAIYTARPSSHSASADTAEDLYAFVLLIERRVAVIIDAVTRGVSRCSIGRHACGRHLSITTDLLAHGEAGPHTTLDRATDEAFVRSSIAILIDAITLGVITQRLTCLAIVAHTPAATAESTGPRADALAADAVRRHERLIHSAITVTVHPITEAIIVRRFARSTPIYNPTVYARADPALSADPLTTFGGDAGIRLV